MLWRRRRACSLRSIATSRRLRRWPAATRRSQRDAVREADRQAVLGERGRRRHQAAPDRLAALAVEHLADREIALGGRDHVGAEALRAAGGLAAQRRRGDADAELEPDQMERPPERGDLAARIDGHAILREAGRRVAGRRAEGDVDALAQVVVDVAAVALAVGDHLDRAVALELAAHALRAAARGRDRGCRRGRTRARAPAARGRWRWRPRPSRSPTWCRRRSC